MDAVSAVASIVGLAGAGAKISLTLFDLAKKIGSAGDEMRSTGVEISLFCAVLKQLERTLNKLSRKRYSISAIEITQEILDHCADIFRRLESELLELGSRVEWKARIKWVTSSKSKFQMQRGTLESCKLTLQIMLTTLNFAETVSSRRVSTINSDQEDEEEELVAACLIAAHQDSIERLQEIEKQASLMESENDESTLVEGEQPRYSKRASTWLQSLGVSHPVDSSNRDSVSSSASANSQLSGLLAKLTDQGTHWTELQAHSKRNSHAISPSATLADADPFKTIDWQRSWLKESERGRQFTDPEPKARVATGSRMESGSTTSRQSPTDTSHKRLNGALPQPMFSALGITTEPVVEGGLESQQSTPRPRYGMPERVARKPPPAPLNLHAAESADIQGPLTSPSPIFASLIARGKKAAPTSNPPAQNLKYTSTNRTLTDESAPQTMHVKAWCRFEAGTIPGSSKSTDLSFEQGEIVEINTQMSPFWSFNRDATNCFDCWLDGRVGDRRGQVPSRAFVPVSSTRKGSILEDRRGGIADGIYIFEDLSLHREFIEKQAKWGNKQMVWTSRQSGGYNMLHHETFSQTIPPWPSYPTKADAESLAPRQAADPPPSPLPISCYMRVTSSDTVDAIIAPTLQRLGLPGTAQDYGLYITYDGNHRLVSAEEKPLRIIKRLMREGKSPTFLVQEKSDIKASEAAALNGGSQTVLS